MLERYRNNGQLSIPDEARRVSDALKRGEDPYPTYTWEQRLARAITDRAGQAEGGAVVVSNRSESSHALLIKGDTGSRIVWTVTVRGIVFTGDIKLSSEQGGFTITAARVINPTTTKLLEEFKGDYQNSGTLGLEGKQIDPTQPYRIWKSDYSRPGYGDMYEVPINTLVQIAEHGHINERLTQVSLARHGFKN